MSANLTPRAKFATTLLRTAAALSRATGRGDGSVIGGRVGLIVEPRLLELLAEGRHVVLVSGTNGKTTTTRFATAALEAIGKVATNSFGANMPTGHTTALAKAPKAEYATLECDEHYLGQLLDAASPKVVALLNLSRDQLDRAMEVTALAAKWRQTLQASAGQTTIVANADDPLIVWAASVCQRVVWVAAGQSWTADSAICPNCGAHLDRFGEFWRCTNCGLNRPSPQWSVAQQGEAVVGPDGRRYELNLQLPGRVNRANAATALAVASLFGVDPAQAAPRLSEVASVAGRYAKVEREGRQLRLLLAKNPAGWLESFDMIEQGPPVVLSLNAREVDGFDTSWIYDVDFTSLAGRKVVVTGDRRTDLAVRLEVDGVDFLVVDDVRAAIAAVPPGPVEVVANYTAFQDIRAEFNRVN
ncbi:MurT ligase domain-containing protein [Glycomyces sp. A-F 0318]|uniref:Mur ligase family protein n=1 Tax=Glycomyces amatae TaxID=2881355 RepID=UPI001E4F3A58|nr:MurT ligase domain-containing protein [Glycomyces amatae]MCD0446668.1 MurT ligase domain-containing protein [Glycomyces amatae]